MNTWTELRQIFPAEWILCWDLLNQNTASASTWVSSVLDHLLFPLPRDNPVLSHACSFKSHSKWNHGNTLFPYPLYPCYYYVSRFLKVEMSCTILRPFSLFLSFSSDIHPHICSSTLQMIMCLSTAEWAVCQHRAWGQCFLTALLKQCFPARCMHTQRGGDDSLI